MGRKNKAQKMGTPSLRIKKSDSLGYSLALIILINIGVFVFAFLLFWIHNSLHGLEETDPHKPIKELLGNFSGELALAFLIAGILNISIEIFNRKRHSALEASMLTAINKAHYKNSRKTIKKINKSLFEVIFKRHIPVSIFEEVDAGLLKAQFFRKHWIVRYVLNIKETPEPNWTGNTKYVLQNVFQSFEVENINKHSSKTFEIKILIDIPPDKDLKNQCRIVSAKINNVSVSNEILDTQRMDDSGQFLKWGTSTEPVEVGKSVFIELEYNQIQYLHGNEVLCAYELPTESMELVVITPQADLSVEVISLHPKDAIPLPPLNDNFSRKWILPYGVIPGQGLYCQWRPGSLVKIDESNKKCQDKIIEVLIVEAE